MPNAYVPWMLTVGELRDRLRNVPDDVAVALTTLPSVTERASTIKTVQVLHEDGPILTLQSVEPPGNTSANRRKPDPTDFASNAYSFAVARAGWFEMTARTLADNTPALSSRCLSEELTPLCRAIVEKYTNVLSADEQLLLKSLPVIRNKLLHLELSRVQGKIRTLGETIQDGGVVQLDIAISDSRLDIGASESRPVSQTSTQDGRIFGWLLEATISGTFSIVADRFLEGVILLERLMEKPITT